jgi:hypothetical protein
LTKKMQKWTEMSMETRDSERARKEAHGGIKPDTPNKRTHVLVNATAHHHHHHHLHHQLCLYAPQGKQKNAQEVPPSPPKHKDEKADEDEAGDFARVGVEPARNERCAY